MCGILAGFNSQTEYVVVGSVALQLAGKIEPDDKLSAQITPYKVHHWISVRVEEIIGNTQWRRFCLPYTESAGIVFADSTSYPSIPPTDQWFVI